MDKSIYTSLKEKAIKTAQKIGLPSFYMKHKKEMESSRNFFENSKRIHTCRSRLYESNLHPAHGVPHCEKVALEAGAIVQIEHTAHNSRESRTEDLIACCQIAGMLHDIKRTEENHTIAGSREAERILRDFDMEERYKRYIVHAIRNHEAFKEVLPSEDETAKLISDSLYDADKFRWGPDNFTVTLWLIMESTQTPAEKLYLDFQEKMKGIKSIKHTFRTGTGKKFGPEFIDAGIEIGNTIYAEISRMMEM